MSLITTKGGSAISFTSSRLRRIITTSDVKRLPEVSGSISPSNSTRGPLYTGSLFCTTLRRCVLGVWTFPGSGYWKKKIRTSLRVPPSASRSRSSRHARERGHPGIGSLGERSLAGSLCVEVARLHASRWDAGISLWDGPESSSRYCKS